MSNVYEISPDVLLRQCWQRVFKSCSQQFSEPADANSTGIDRWLSVGGYKVPVKEVVYVKPFRGEITVALQKTSAEGVVEPGWIHRELGCQYVGFLWPQDHHFEVFPFLPLQTWWQDQMSSVKRRQRTHHLWPMANVKHESGSVTKYAIVRVDMVRRGINTLCEQTNEVQYGSKKGERCWREGQPAEPDSDD